MSSSSDGFSSEGEGRGGGVRDPPALQPSSRPGSPVAIMQAEAGPVLKFRGKGRGGWKPEGLDVEEQWEGIEERRRRERQGALRRLAAREVRVSLGSIFWVLAAGVALQLAVGLMIHGRASGKIKRLESSCKLQAARMHKEHTHITAKLHAEMEARAEDHRIAVETTEAYKKHRVHWAEKPSYLDGFSRSWQQPQLSDPSALAGYKPDRVSLTAKNVECENSFSTSARRVQELETELAHVKARELHVMERLPGPAQYELIDLPPPWVLHEDPSGRIFYYNPISGVAQWTSPHSTPPPPPPRHVRPVREGGT